MARAMLSRARLLTMLFAVVVAACSTPGAHGLAEQRSRLLPRPATPAALSIGTYIKHVVVIVQENRSFENVFAGFSGADAPMTGNLNGAIIPLRQTQINSIYDLGHAFHFSLAGYDKGKMDRFDNNRVTTVPTGGTRPAGRFAYSFLNRAQIAPYRIMAKRYVLADRMFPTEFGGSFTAHLDLIAGTTNLSPTLAEVDRPNAGLWGCDSPPGTITSTLTADRIPR